MKTVSSGTWRTWGGFCLRKSSSNDIDTRILKKKKKLWEIRKDSSVLAKVMKEFNMVWLCTCACVACVLTVYKYTSLLAEHTEEQICETSPSRCLHSSGEIGSEWLLSPCDWWRLLVETTAERTCRTGSRGKLLDQYRTQTITGMKGHEWEGTVSITGPFNQLTIFMHSYIPSSSFVFYHVHAGSWRKVRLQHKYFLPRCLEFPWPDIWNDCDSAALNLFIVSKPMLESELVLVGSPQSCGNRCICSRMAGDWRLFSLQLTVFLNSC